MNAAETIAAAIEKLEALRAEVLGEVMVQETEQRDWMVTSVAFDEPYLVTDSQAIADAFVTLHRTIDAQLTILMDANKALSNPVYMAEYGAWAESIFKHALLIARAILGEVS